MELCKVCRLKKSFYGLKQSHCAWFEKLSEVMEFGLERYGRLVGKLNYHTVTRPNIAFPVSVLSQFISSHRTY